MTEEIEKLCENLINVVRNMMQQLHPLVLTELGLKAALEDLLMRWSTLYPALKVNLECDDQVDQSGSNMSIQLFRVIQECLTNIVRHSRAATARISLKAIPSPVNRIYLSVIDDGLGCTAGQIKKGFGLLGMKERTQSLGGTFKIETQPGRGFAIKLELPLNETTI
jgi:two-component system sensor histidine kinase UhpB